MYIDLKLNFLQNNLLLNYYIKQKINVSFISKREQQNVTPYKKNIYVAIFKFYRLTMLAGLGSPLRLILDGGLNPDGFGIPVDPVLIFISVDGSWLSVAGGNMIVLTGFKPDPTLLRDEVEDILYERILTV